MSVRRDPGSYSTKKKKSSSSSKPKTSGITPGGGRGSYGPTSSGRDKGSSGGGHKGKPSKSIGSSIGSVGVTSASSAGKSSKSDKKKAKAKARKSVAKAKKSLSVATSHLNNETYWNKREKEQRKRQLYSYGTGPAAYGELSKENQKLVRKGKRVATVFGTDHVPAALRGKQMRDTSVRSIRYAQAKSLKDQIDKTDKAIKEEPNQAVRKNLKAQRARLLKDYSRTRKVIAGVNFRDTAKIYNKYSDDKNLTKAAKKSLNKQFRQATKDVFDTSFAAGGLKANWKETKKAQKELTEAYLRAANAQTSEEFFNSGARYQLVAHGGKQLTPEEKRYYKQTSKDDPSAVSSQDFDVKIFNPIVGKWEKGKVPATEYKSLGEYVGEKTKGITRWAGAAGFGNPTSLDTLIPNKEEFARRAEILSWVAPIPIGKGIVGGRLLGRALEIFKATKAGRATVAAGEELALHPSIIASKNAAQVIKNSKTVKKIGDIAARGSAGLAERRAAVARVEQAADRGEAVPIDVWRARSAAGMGRLRKVGAVTRRTIPTAAKDAGKWADDMKKLSNPFTKAERAVVAGEKVTSLSRIPAKAITSPVGTYVIGAGALGGITNPKDEVNALVDVLSEAGHLTGDLLSNTGPEDIAGLPDAAFKILEGAARTTKIALQNPGETAKGLLEAGSGIVIAPLYLTHEALTNGVLGMLNDLGTAVGDDYSYRWGPALEGDWETFDQRAHENPVWNILDVWSGLAAASWTGKAGAKALTSGALHTPEGSAVFRAATRADRFLNEPRPGLAFASGEGGIAPQELSNRLFKTARERLTDKIRYQRTQRIVRDVRAGKDVKGKNVIPHDNFENSVLPYGIGGRLPVVGKHLAGDDRLRRRLAKRTMGQAEMKHNELLRNYIIPMRNMLYGRRAKKGIPGTGQRGIKGFSDEQNALFPYLHHFGRAYSPQEMARIPLADRQHLTFLNNHNLDIPSTRARVAWQMADHLVVIRDLMLEARRKADWEDIGIPMDFGEVGHLNDLIDGLRTSPEKYLSESFKDKLLKYDSMLNELAMRDPTLAGEVALGALFKVQNDSRLIRHQAQVAPYLAAAEKVENELRELMDQQFHNLNPAHTDTLEHFRSRREKYADLPYKEQLAKHAAVPAEHADKIELVNIKELAEYIDVRRDKPIETFETSEITNEMISVKYDPTENPYYRDLEYDLVTNGMHNPIRLAYNDAGELFIHEGNHRALIALRHGLDQVPVIVDNGKARKPFGETEPILQPKKKPTLKSSESEFIAPSRFGFKTKPVGDNYNGEFPQYKPGPYMDIREINYSPEHIAMRNWYHGGTSHTPLTQIDIDPRIGEDSLFNLHGIGWYMTSDPSIAKGYMMDSTIKHPGSVQAIYQMRVKPRRILSAPSKAGKTVRNTFENFFEHNFGKNIDKLIENEHIQYHINGMKQDVLFTHDSLKAGIEAGVYDGYPGEQGVYEFLKMNGIDLRNLIDRYGDSAPFTEAELLNPGAFKDVNAVLSRLAEWKPPSIQKVREDGIKYINGRMKEKLNNIKTSVNGAGEVTYGNFTNHEFIRQAAYLSDDVLQFMSYRFPHAHFSAKDFYMQFTRELMKKGYDGIADIGGTRMNKPRHQHLILFDPNRISTSNPINMMHVNNDADIMARKIYDSYRKATAMRDKVNQMDKRRELFGDTYIGDDVRADVDRINAAGHQLGLGKPIYYHASLTDTSKLPLEPQNYLGKSHKGIMPHDLDKNTLQLQRLGLRDLNPRTQVAHMLQRSHKIKDFDNLLMVISQVGLRGENGLDHLKNLGIKVPKSLIGKDGKTTLKVRTRKQLVEVIHRAGGNPADYQYLNLSRMRELLGNLGESDMTLADGHNLSDVIKNQGRLLERVMDEASAEGLKGEWVAVHNQTLEHVMNRIAQSKIAENKAYAYTDKIVHYINDMPKAFASRILLAPNLSWQQFQVYANASLATLAGAGPRTWMEALKEYRRWDEPTQRAFSHHMGVQTHHLDIAAMDQSLYNFFHNTLSKHPAYRRYAEGRNFFDMFFWADRKNNEFFRKAVLYNEVKRQAYRDLNKSGSLMAQALDRAWKGATGKSKSGKVEERMQAIVHDPQLMDDLARRTEDFMGDYLNFSVTERNIMQRSVMFYGFLRHSLQFTLWNLPIKHPMRARLIGLMSAIAVNDAKAMLGSEDLDARQLGVFYLKGPVNIPGIGTIEPGDNGLTEIDLTRASIVGNLLIEGLSADDPWKKIVPAMPMLSNPVWQPLLESLQGQSFYKGTPLRGTLEGTDYGDPNFHWDLASSLSFSDKVKYVSNSWLSLFRPYRVALNATADYPSWRKSNVQMLGKEYPYAYSEKDGAESYKEAIKDTRAFREIQSGGIINSTLQQELLPFFPVPSDTPELLQFEAEQTKLQDEALSSAEKAAKRSKWTGKVDGSPLGVANEIKKRKKVNHSLDFLNR